MCGSWVQQQERLKSEKEQDAPSVMHYSWGALFGLVCFNEQQMGAATGETKNQKRSKNHPGNALKLVHIEWFALQLLDK